MSLSDEIKKGYRKMSDFKFIDFKPEQHGFTGHLVIPEPQEKTAVIVLSGGEKSLLPGKSVAKQFAKNGYPAMAVPIFGTEGLPDTPDKMPLDPVIKAAQFLQGYDGIDKVVMYGMSMGSIFAILTAAKVPGIAGVISVSGTHVIIEGEIGKNTSGHSLVTYSGQELPYLPYTMKDGVFEGFQKAYKDEENVKKAALPVEDCNCPVLILVSDSDEEWPAEKSAEFIKNRLETSGYKHPYKTVVYKNASHLIGMLPDDFRGKIFTTLAKMFFASMKQHPQECKDAVKASQTEITEFLKSL